MGLSAELQERLDVLQANRPHYAHLGPSLGEKSIMLLVAGIGSGKSTIAQKMEAMSAAKGIVVKEVGTHTTRGRKPTDPENYTTDIPHEEIISDIEQGVPINWSLIEKTGHIYATYEDGLAAQHNVLPTLPDSVPMFIRSGLKTQVVYVARPVDEWRRQFTEPITDPAIYGRIDETLSSIEFLNSEQEIDGNAIDIVKIVNHDGEEALRKTAGALLDIMKVGANWRQKARPDTSLTDGFDSHISNVYNAGLEMLRDAEIEADER
jgi:hypothetical protein